MRFRLFVVLLLLLLAACGGPSRVVESGPTLQDTIEIHPVRNLARVSLQVPEIYLGDDVSKAMELDVDDIDLKLLGEAAIYAHLDQLGYRVALRDEGAFGDGAKYEIHAAFTDFNMTELRTTGMFSMAMVVMVIEASTQDEVMRGTAHGEYQLLDRAPDEVGAIGEQRFIERRLQMFTENLARRAVEEAGF